MKKQIFVTCLCALMLLSLGFNSLSATNLKEKTNDNYFNDDQPPIIEIVNPTEGYFHFSGIKLFPTILNLIADTMGFGGFRIRPVQVKVKDDIDPPQDIKVYMYVKENEQGNMTWNNLKQLYERKWIGPDLGVFNMNISAEDTSGNIAYKEMDVWYFCFIPE